MKKIIFIILILIGGFAVAQDGYPKLKTMTLEPQSAPANPIEGQIYYDTVQKAIFVYNGSNWVNSTADAVVLNNTTTSTSTTEAATANIAKVLADEIQNIDAELATTGLVISNHTSEISSLQTALNTTTTSAFNFEVVDEDHTLTREDLEDNKILLFNSVFTKDEITVPSGVFNVGEAVRIVYGEKSTSTAYILASSNVSIDGYSSLQMNEYPSGFTLVRKNSNTNPEEFVVVDTFGRINNYISPDPNEVNLSYNATSHLDSDSYIGFTPENNTEGALRTSTDAYLSDYSVSQELIVDGAVTYFLYAFTAEIGDTFDVSFDAKRNNTTGIQRIFAWQNVLVSPNITPSVRWENYTTNIEATGTTVRLVFYVSGNDNGLAGDKLCIDNLLIIKTN